MNESFKTGMGSILAVVDAKGGRMGNHHIDKPTKADPINEQARYLLDYSHPHLCFRVLKGDTWPVADRAP